MKTKRVVADIGAIIRKERRKRKLKKALIARATGVKPLWLRRTEGGKRRIYIDEFLTLADAIGFNAVRAIRKLVRRRAKSPSGEFCLMSRALRFDAS
jgi:transcriptional regulator with XRE-family HTH domain